MTGPGADPARPAYRPPGRDRALVATYALAVLVAAALLFGVQPMTVRMALPAVGGSPAAWNAAQVFFQALLLAGYLYAHALARVTDRRVAVGVHLALLATAFALLPIALPEGWAPAPEAAPAPALLAALTEAVGLPFFAVAATAPLLQHWFSLSTHARAGDPYFLYSASNLGGLAALIGYPLLLEPLLGLARQSALWSAGFALLAILIAVAGIAIVGGSRAGARGGGARAGVAASDRHADASRGESPGAALRLRWLALAFAPSSLMLGVTLHLTTDVAAVPLLWVAPLALYLLTWVIAFARSPPIPHAWVLRAQPVLVCALAVAFATSALAPAFALHLGAFWLCALACHGELARTRPHAGRLTEFYLWVSLGGLLGGAFSGLLAPRLFDAVVEYPLALVLACALRPRNARTASGAGEQSAASGAGALLAPVALALGYLLAARTLHRLQWVDTAVPMAVVAACVALVLWTLRAHPARFALGTGLVLLVTLLDHSPARRLAQERSFFGVHRVLVSADGNHHLLVHGTTVHGAQAWPPSPRPEPLTYYAREGPAGQVFESLRRRMPDARIGVVGLGAGSLACLRRPAQPLTFFEIDPTVVELASDPALLSYLERCGDGVSIVRGDGRRSVAAWDGAPFDLLVIDAFSSDSIPLHLLTREALALYASRLAPHGVLLLHLSNRHLDLVRVAAATAAAAGLAVRAQHHEPGAGAGRYAWESVWMLAAGDTGDLAAFTRDPRWRTPKSTVRPWRDDYADVVGAMRWRAPW